MPKSNYSLRSDTVYTINDYNVVFNKGYLKCIFKKTGKDSINIVFGEKDFRVDDKRNKILREYFFDDKVSFNKLKYTFLKDGKDVENQIVSIDTTATNFLITNNSRYVVMKDLPDTLLVREKKVIFLNIVDSVFDNFSLNIIRPGSFLSFKKENIIKRVLFFQKNGISDTIVFDSPGIKYYEGVIENFKPLENGRRASLANYFKKKIVVVDK